jgi:hypothetical protein
LTFSKLVRVTTKTIFFKDQNQFLAHCAFKNWIFRNLKPVLDSPLAYASARYTNLASQPTGTGSKTGLKVAFFSEKSEKNQFFKNIS